MDAQALCKLCGKEHDSSYGSGNFCSARCAHIREFTGQRTKQVTLTCAYCKENFVRPYKRRHARFCSKSCTLAFARTSDPEHQRNAGKKSAQKQRAIRRSQNEVLFASMCKSEFENVLENSQMFNGWDADVILVDHKVAVLWNGAWHYKEIMPGTSLKQIQTRDRIKIDEINKAGFHPYIIVDMGKHDPKFVNDQFNTFKDFIAGVENRHLSSLIS